MFCRLHAVADTSEADRFFDALVRCETRLYNALGERLRAECGIVTSQFELLRHLRDHPRTRVVDVAAAFAAGVGAISKGVDRLERAGWVARVANPADRRSSLLELTAPGAALVERAEHVHLERLEELVRPALDDAQLRALADALTRLRTGLEADRVGLPVG